MLLDARANPANFPDVARHPRDRRFRALDSRFGRQPFEAISRQGLPPLPIGMPIERGPIPNCGKDRMLRSLSGMDHTRWPFATPSPERPG